ncbi:MAG: OmpA family protein [Boseongicola sp. SB0676_bin_33]|nr:OmpA family protein [Boseongicola sp. SB0676_bin_33]
MACRGKECGHSLACRRNSGHVRHLRDDCQWCRPARLVADASRVAKRAGREAPAIHGGPDDEKRRPLPGPFRHSQDGRREIALQTRNRPGGGLCDGWQPCRQCGFVKLRFVICLVMATPASALDLALPNAVTAAVETSDAASARLPEAPWSPDVVVLGTEGAIRKTVLKLPDAQWTTLQLIMPLRDKLEEAGYVQAFSCADAECGGFDFRFQLDLIGEPDMYVDLGNYRYLLMRHSSNEPHSVALVASPTGSAGNIHITEVSSARIPEMTPMAEGAGPEAEEDADRTAREPGTLAASLMERGHVVLDALEFGSGSADLGNGPYPVLAELAAWLLDNPSARIVLVGHTDSMGSLETNTTLSRRRAEAVAGRLIEAFGIDPVRLEAAGAGYLSPIESNLTEPGRTANRRVEAVLISVE